MPSPWIHSTLSRCALCCSACASISARDVDRIDPVGPPGDHPRQPADAAPDVDDGIALLDARAQLSQHVVEVALALFPEARLIGLAVGLAVVDEEHRVLAGALIPEVTHPMAAHGPKTTMEGMAGHSKWAGIKHKKAIVDARRGKLFTKLARGITVAAKEGGGDTDSNPALALAVQKAKDASMPKDNIERAIAKGTGEGADADALETVLYEGYGPGGVALLIEAVTDNRNRTGSEIRHILTKHGGSLGEPGSVAYLFDKRGVVVVDASRYGEDDLMGAIDAGALDIEQDDDVFEVLTEPAALSAVREALTDAGVEIESAELRQQPKTRVPVDDDAAPQLLRLIDALDEQDDVDVVHANFDVSADVLERVAG